jgi:hypothetical protein
MVRSLWRFLDRTPRRRWTALSLIILAAGLATWAVWRQNPTLSPVERALVGEWGRAEPSLGAATIARGRTTNLWVVQEFASDRTYRQWFVSADDTRNNFALVQSRWRVVDGVIRLEAEPIGGRVVADAGTRIARWTGLPLASPSYISEPRDIPFRLIGTNDLELRFRNQNRPDWKRLAGSFKVQPRLSLQRTGSAEVASP